MMKMKKNIIALGLIVAATFALTNCTKEIENPADGQESAGIPFEITASSVETKTTNDGFNTAWKAGDKMSVFHVEAGQTALGANDMFAISAEDLESKVFKGTLSVALEAGKAYDWHAFYPYKDNFDDAKIEDGLIGFANYGATCNSGAVSTGLKQDGNDSMNHLAGDKFPMYGTVSGLAADASVSVDMKHLMSVIELEVTNNASEAVTVTEVLFSAPVHLVGSFYYDTVNEEYEVSSESYCSKTAKLAVANAQPIAKGGKAKFYLAVVPVSVEEGEITMTVTTDKGTCVKTKTLVAGNASDDLVLKAGKIRKMTFAYDAAVVVKKVSLPWTEDFSGNLDNYTISDGGGTTKIYESDNLAGGTAPEILIAKGSGSLGVNVDLGGKSGFLTLSFRSNNDYVDVTSSTNGVDVSKVTQGIFHISVPSGLSILQLALTNTNEKSNVRVDDICLQIGKVLLQSLSFETPSYSFTEGSQDISSFTGQSVSGNETTVAYTSDNTDVAVVDAQTGEVTLKSALGTAIITAIAEETAEYFSASASYSITILPSVNTTDEAIDGTTAVTVSDGVGVIVTDSGITITQAKANSSTNVNDSYVTVNTMRIYKGQTLTFAGKTFTRIVLTYKNSYSGNSMTASSGALTTDTENKTVTWEGYSDNVVIQNVSSETNVQLRLDHIDVTYAVN